MFQDRDKDIRTTTNNKASDAIKTEIFRYPHIFKGLKTSESEIRAKDRNSEDDEDPWTRFIIY
jgi:hypothetical protein